MEQKILYFDDEPDYVEVLIKNLELNHGWTADKKGKIKYIWDPAKMIDEIYSSNLYDLFVMDIMITSYGIEKKNIFDKKELQRIYRDNNMGILIAEKIRSIEKYKDTPIIFVSAKGNNEIPDSIKPPFDCVVKPTLARELSKKMEEILTPKEQNK